MDYSDKETNSQLKTLTKRIEREYENAYGDLKQTSEKYFAELEQRYLEQYDAYKNGAYTDQQFTDWYIAQVGRGQRWEALRDQMADRMVTAEKAAANYMNDVTPNIYAMNHNYAAYSINRVHRGADFKLVDENTVRQLMEGSRPILPKKKVKVDKALEWNKRRLQSALTQGILQGDSIDKLAKRFQSVTTMDKKSAVRNARTAVTGAQNAGRMATYEEADEMGIEIQKEWISTLDDRTRETHQDMDGVRVPYDEPFQVGNSSMMYPGDMNGDPEEVYNCRCTMRAIIPSVNDSRNVERRGRGTNNQSAYFQGTTYKGEGGTMSYKDWLNAKGG